MCVCNILFAIRRLLLFRNLFFRRLFLWGPTNIQYSRTLVPPYTKATKWIGNAKHRKQFSPLSFNIFWIIFCVFYLFLGRPSPVWVAWCRLQTIIHIRLNDNIPIELLFVYTEQDSIKYNITVVHSIFFFFFCFRLHRLFSFQSHALVIQIVMWCVHNFDCATNQRKHLNDLRIV